MTSDWTDKALHLPKAGHIAGCARTQGRNLGADCAGGVRFGMSCRLICLLLLCAPGIGSSQVYRSVGPDGKVTYSDSPPAAAAKVDQKPDIRARPPRPEDDPVTAAMQVYVKITLVEEFYRFCRDEVPSSAADVLRARNLWNDQNAGLAAAVKVIVNDRYTTRELLKIAGDTERENLGIVAEIRKASAKEKSLWCSQAPAKMASMEMNPSRNPTLTKTLLNYKPR